MRGTYTHFNTDFTNDIFHLTDLVKNSKSVRRNLGKYTDLP